jgi:hypothetical protein
MPLAGIQANFGLDPRLRRSGVTSWVEHRFHFLGSRKLMAHFVVNISSSYTLRLSAFAGDTPDSEVAVTHQVGRKRHTHLLELKM